jgi:hypothetical protein
VRRSVFWIGYAAAAMLGADAAAMLGASGPTIVIAAAGTAFAWTFVGIALEVVTRRRR